MPRQKRIDTGLGVHLHDPFRKVFGLVTPLQGTIFHNIGLAKMPENMGERFNRKAGNGEHQSVSLGA